MENKIFLGKYRGSFDAGGMPIELRRNATGVTCEAEEIESGREVALELVPARSLVAESREKIEADAIAAKQLNHVNIPALYDFGFDNGDLVYVTEYFDGTTAESWVTTHGPMPVRAVLCVALQVVSALGAAAFQLVMHRAIHPGNILIVPGQTPEGNWPLIKVLNFGRILPSARAPGDSSSRDKSAPFASPEQLVRGTVDFRSEIYSLGCTLWSLLTGVSPFNAPGEPVAAAQMAPAMKRFRGVPRKVGRLIAEMVSMNPDDRPLDPVVMTQQLQDALAHVERREALARKLGIPATWQQRRLARRARRPVMLRPIAVAAMLLALAALAAVILTKSSRPDSLWKRFTAREPIGVPVGIPEASLATTGNSSGKTAGHTDSATAANESDLIDRLNSTENETKSGTAAPVASVPPPTASPPVVASANQNAVILPQGPPPSNESTQTAASAESNTSASQNAAAPSQNSQPNEPAQTTASVANSVSAAETAAGATETPAASQPNEQLGNPSSASIVGTTAAAPAALEAASTPPAANIDTATAQPADSATAEGSATVAANKVPRAELIEPPPVQSLASRKESTDAPTQNVVPRAELIEPPPPAQGPDDSATDGSANETSAQPALEKMEGVPRAELIEPPPASPSKRTQRKRPRSTSSSLTRAERDAIRNAGRRTRRVRITPDGDGAMVQTPDGIVHARFVGTTPDGKWMLALPSRKIMVVPPPPGFTPR